MGSSDAIDFLTKKHNSIPAVEPNGKIIPMVGAVGKFEYDIVKDEVTCDEINRLMVGLESNTYKYADVLEKVDGKTRFQEQTLGYRGNESIVESSPILVNNGNIIAATYNMVFHKDIGLVGINGLSRLVKVA